MSDLAAVTRPDGYGQLVGHRFPGGSYTLPAYEAWLWADAVGARHDPATANPGMAYMIGVVAGGASIADIMALLGADADSGVLFGGIEIDLTRPLAPGTTYDVDGEVVAVERKSGRRAGEFDRVTFVHRLAAEGEPVATVTHVWIFPRADGGAAG